MVIHQGGRLFWQVSHNIAPDLHNMSQDANDSKCSASIKSHFVYKYIEKILSDFKGVLKVSRDNYVSKFECIFFGTLSTGPMFISFVKRVVFGDMSQTY